MMKHLALRKRIVFTVKRQLRTSLAITAIAVVSTTVLLPSTQCFTLLHLRHAGSTSRLFSSIMKVNGGVSESSQLHDWSDLLPFADSSHRSAKISIPASSNDAVEYDVEFKERLKATVTACRELGKSSIWVEVPMSRCSLIESGDMKSLGFQFHHAIGDTAVLNLWLRDGVASKVPEFATHNVGVGAVVVNSRDEILCVRELHRNYQPWKTPTGLSDLGEQIDDAAVREVFEETGIRTTFHSILSFRQTHGLTHGRSDLFFVCRLDPVEDVDENGNRTIPEPHAQACEIERAQWVPLDEYRAMVNDEENGHPMMRHVIQIFDAGKRIEKSMVHSIIPGRQPNAIYFPHFDQR